MSSRPHHQRIGGTQRALLVIETPKLGGPRQQSDRHMQDVVGAVVHHHIFPGFELGKDRWQAVVQIVCGHGVQGESVLHRSLIVKA